MANTQPRNSQAPHHTMPHRSESLFEPFAEDTAKDLVPGGGCVHADSARDTAPLSAPVPVPVADADAVVVGGRQGSSSSEETEEGFVVVGDEVGAPWDPNQPTHPTSTPTLMSTPIHSARQTWTSFLPSRLKSTASSLAELSSPKQRQPSMQDVSAWELEPQLEDAAFGTPNGALKNEASVPSSKEARLRRFRARLTESDEAKRPGGLFFVVQEQRNDPLGDSVAWQRRGQPVEGSGAGQGRRAAVLEAWKAKEERADHAERDALSGRTRAAEMKRRTSKMILRDGWYEKMGGAATGRTKEEAELRLREQMWRREEKEGWAAELDPRTGKMILRDGWYERMGGASTGRTKEEAEERLREQTWRRATKKGWKAELERRRAARGGAESAGLERGAGS